MNRTPSLDYFAATVRARDSAIDAVQEAACAVTESVAAELSRRWPRRLVTLWTGNGDSHLTVSTRSIYGRPAYWTFTLGALPEHESNYVTESTGHIAMSPDARLPDDLAQALRDVEAESIHTSALIGGSEGRMIWKAGKRLAACPHDWQTDSPCALVDTCRLCMESRA